MSEYRLFYYSILTNNLQDNVIYLQIFIFDVILSQIDMNVEQIAGEVGYSDMKHLYSVFKK